MRTELDDTLDEIFYDADTNICESVVHSDLAGKPRAIYDSVSKFVQEYDQIKVAQAIADQFEDI